MTTDATAPVTPAATPMTAADEKALKRIGYVLGAGAGVCAVMAVYTGLAQHEARADFNTSSQIARTVERDTQPSFTVKVSSSQFLR